MIIMRLQNIFMKSFYNVRNVCVIMLSENGKIQNFMYIMKLLFLNAWK